MSPIPPPDEEPDYTCEWCLGTGVIVIEHVDGRTEKRICEDCGGSGEVKSKPFDPDARRRDP